MGRVVYHSHPPASARPLEGEPQFRAELHRLGAAFTDFRRREPRRNTRIPASLRAMVLAAWRRGVPAAALHRVCGVSAAQLEQWRFADRSSAEPTTAVGAVRATAVPPPRVFTVVDAPDDGKEEVGDGADGAGAPVVNGGRALELRFGGWAITVRAVSP
jgi:hypothetical protein